VGTVEEKGRGEHGGELGDESLERDGTESTTANELLKVKEAFFIRKRVPRC
jgi:hypothetical protein